MAMKPLYALGMVRGNGHAFQRLPHLTSQNLVECTAVSRIRSSKSIWSSVRACLLRWWIGEEESRRLIVLQNFEDAASLHMAFADSRDETTVVQEMEDKLRTSRVVSTAPRFAVHVACALRAELGLDAMDRNVPGNVQYVRRRIAKELAKYNVRVVDRAAHLKPIEDIFFGDDTHFKVSETRMRVASRSKFARWLLGERAERPKAMKF